MKSKKIEISEETRMELIFRVLILDKVLDAKDKNIEEINLGMDKLIKRAEDINVLIFDDNFLEKLSEVLEG